mmetsp:Transcript_18640/g.46769  ORF Transcript_18640/g.46769 Transcript_18640/m.46769 type:complete len:139 (+) Transcript_18640:301-717(+)
MSKVSANESKVRLFFSSDDAHRALAMSMPGSDPNIAKRARIGITSLPNAISMARKSAVGPGLPDNKGGRVRFVIEGWPREKYLEESRAIRGWAHPNSDAVEKIEKGDCAVPLYFVPGGLFNKKELLLEKSRRQAFLSR